MADTKISGLPTAGPLTGAELVPVVQNNGSGNVTVKTTVSAIIRQAAVNENTTVNVLLTPDDTGKCISNKGATAQITAQLPPADPSQVLEYEFVNQTSFGMLIDLQGNDIAYEGNLQSSPGGTIQSLTYGTLRIRSMNGTDWVIMSATGDWALG